MTRYACIDGRILAEEKATVPVLDRGLLLGDGIFETIRVTAGLPELFDEHVARLGRSAAAIRLRQPWSRETLEELCVRLCRKSGLAEASVRITLTRGAYRGTLSDTGDPPRLVMTCAPVSHLPPAIYSRGVAVATASFPRVHAVDPRVKSLCYLPNVLARLEADEKGAYEAVFTDARRRILELATASFFAVRDGELLTPPLSAGILPGVTRASVIALAREAGLRVRERHIPAADAAEWSEAFLTSAVRGIIPIVRFDGARVGTGRRGPTTKRLQQLFAASTGRA